MRQLFEVLDAHTIIIQIRTRIPDFHGQFLSPDNELRQDAAVVTVGLEVRQDVLQQNGDGLSVCSVFRMLFGIFFTKEIKQQ